MKKQIAPGLRNTARKFFTYVIACLLLINYVPATAQAQEGTTKQQPTTSNGIVFQYLGTINQQLYFQVEFENKNGETFFVTINDEEGNVLYKARFKDRKFHKKFQLDGTEVDEAKLTFTVYTTDQKEAQAFRVNAGSRIMEDVVVTRL